ncbi:MAG TPA: hypothetical protein VK973_12190 [Arenicellales bacterium]|nr:hypothetical protein [Arenicellales bacterium]
MIDEEVIVTLRDIRALRYCSRGARQFCARHGLDYSDFLRNGISSRELLATGDAMAIKAVEVARGRR